MPAVLADAAGVLESACASLGVAASPTAFDSLRGLVDRLPDTDHAALSPSDACPDNNVGTSAGLVLVDFEGAEFRHVAWDVAYLTVPWPSCWCSWRLPDHVAAGALAHYRDVLGEALPYVTGRDFERDVDTAAAGWSFISTAWFLRSALDDDPPPMDPRQIRPTRRAMIAHRLARAATSEFPALSELARGLRAALVQRWGEVPLALAPAFRERPSGLARPHQ
jgi:hypothetical protein